jgi:outer membrane protein assembly factor BamB
LAKGIIALAAGLPTIVSAAALATSIANPANPVLTKSGVVIADDGVSYFDNRTRSLRWQSLQHLQTDAPTLAGEQLFVGTSRGLYALEMAGGRVLWHFPSQSRLFSPVVAGESVYLSGEDGSLRSLNAGSGEVLWTRHFSGWLYSPAVSGGFLVIAGQAHRLTALARADGALIWQRSLPHEPVFRPVLVGDEMVVVTTFAADILALDTGTGELRWSVRDSIASFSPQVHGDRLYFRTMDGGLRVRRIEDGALQWTAALEGRSQHPLVFRGDHVLALDGEARLRIYNIDTGMPVTDPSSVVDGNDLLGRFGGHTVILDGKDTVVSRSGRPTARSSAARSTEERKQ